MAAKLKKGDKVVVLSGRDKGRRGEIVEMMPKRARAKVQGVNLVRKHRKPSAGNPGGIETMEAPIHVSNLAIEDPKDGSPTRVGFKILEDGRKVRFAKKSGELIDG